MEKYTWVEVNLHSDGTVRIYGNAGMIFEAQGENVKMTSVIFPKPMPPSGEAVVKKP